METTESEGRRVSVVNVMETENRAHTKVSLANIIQTTEKVCTKVSAIYLMETKSIMSGRYIFIIDYIYYFICVLLVKCGDPGRTANSRKIGNKHRYNDHVEYKI